MGGSRSKRTGYCSPLRAALRLHALFATPVRLNRENQSEGFFLRGAVLQCKKHNFSERSITQEGGDSPLFSKLLSGKIVFFIRYNLPAEREPAGGKPGYPTAGVANSELERSVLSSEQYPAVGYPGPHRSHSLSGGSLFLYQRFIYLIYPMKVFPLPLTIPSISLWLTVVFVPVSGSI